MSFQESCVSRNVNFAYKYWFQAIIQQRFLLNKIALESARGSPRRFDDALFGGQEFLFQTRAGGNGRKGRRDA